MAREEASLTNRYSNGSAGNGILKQRMKDSNLMSGKTAEPRSQTSASEAGLPQLVIGVGGIYIS
ncbi:hypothetical protein LTR66_005352, partial [Elasticomyces elasticus]